MAGQSVNPIRFSRPIPEARILQPDGSVHQSLIELDRRPGVPLEFRGLAGDVNLFIAHIADESGVPTRPQLVLRCEPDGEVFAAIYEPQPEEDCL